MNENELIDETQPGSGRDGGDGVAEQLDVSDTLDYRGVDDPLDEGYTVPEHAPSVQVPTADEEERGLSLDELLSAEEPDVSADDDGSLFDESGNEVGDVRSGRLVESGLGSYEVTEKELWAGDVGIDGAGASAEEAAVHVIDPDRDR